MSNFEDNVKISMIRSLVFGEELSHDDSLLVPFGVLKFGSQITEDFTRVLRQYRVLEDLSQEIQILLKNNNYDFNWFLNESPFAVVDVLEENGVSLNSILEILPQKFFLSSDKTTLDVSEERWAKVFCCIMMTFDIEKFEDIPIKVLNRIRTENEALLFLHIYEFVGGELANIPEYFLELLPHNKPLGIERVFLKMILWRLAFRMYKPFVGRRKFKRIFGLPPINHYSTTPTRQIKDIPEAEIKILERLGFSRSILKEKY